MPGQPSHAGNERLWKLREKEVQPAMPGLAFLRKREVLFVSREKHTDSLGMCGVRHIVNPDRHLSRMKYNELEVALQARTKSSARWVDYLADAHLFRPKVFVIDHRASPSAHLLRT